MRVPAEDCPAPHDLRPCRPRLVPCVPDNCQNADPVTGRWSSACPKLQIQAVVSVVTRLWIMLKLEALNPTAHYLLTSLTVVVTSHRTYIMNNPPQRSAIVACSRRPGQASGGLRMGLDLAMAAPHVLSHDFPERLRDSSTTTHLPPCPPRLPHVSQSG